MLSVKANISAEPSPYGRLGGSLAEAARKAAEQVRRNPQRPEPRQMLADLFCLEGAWERALKQAQAAAMADPAFMAEAFAFRLLIQCETFRAEVFSGRKSPMWLGAPPEWAAHMQEALKLSAGADAESVKAMDAAREAAFALAGDVAGQSNLGSFAWICDSDTRLGPVCEAIMNGRHIFIPFSAIAEIKAQEPGRPRDLVWLPAQIRLKGEAEAAPAFIPARYPGSEKAGEDLLLARRTEWRDVGETGVYGLGQKTWMTDQGDLPLLDLRSCIFAE